MPALGKIMLDEPIKDVELGMEIVKKWRLMEAEEDLRGKLERGEEQEESGEEFNFGLNASASDLLPIPRFPGSSSISKPDIKG